MTNPAIAKPRSAPPVMRTTNMLVTILLRSPLHRLMSNNTMLITFVGRTSGKHITTPISYIRDGDTIMCITTGAWWKNVRVHSVVEVLVRGKHYHGHATVVVADSDENHSSVARQLQTVLRRVRRDASLYHVRFDPDGTPNWEDAWRVANKARAIRIDLAR